MGGVASYAAPAAKKCNALWSRCVAWGQPQAVMYVAMVFPTPLDWMVVLWLCVWC